MQKTKSSGLDFLLVIFHQELNNLKHARFSVLAASRVKCSFSVFQSTFQTVQLTATAEIDTHNPQLFVTEENAVTVSVTRSSL